MNCFCFFENLRSLSKYCIGLSEDFACLVLRCLFNLEGFKLSAYKVSLQIKQRGLFTPSLQLQVNPYCKNESSYFLFLFDLSTVFFVLELLPHESANVTKIVMTGYTLLFDFSKRRLRSILKNTFLGNG